MPVHMQLVLSRQFVPAMSRACLPLPMTAMPRVILNYDIGLSVPSSKSLAALVETRWKSFSFIYTASL